MATVLLDVRTESEFADGHYDGAIHHDVQKIMDGILPPISKQDDIRIYCRSGMRAMAAEQLLKSAGFIHVTTIGGYNGTAYP